LAVLAAAVFAAALDLVLAFLVEGVLAADVLVTAVLGKEVLAAAGLITPTGLSSAFVNIFGPFADGEVVHCHTPFIIAHA